MNKQEELYLQAKTAYYNGNSEMSDDDFDKLESLLREQGSKFVDIVGSENGSYTIQHLSPMLSLEKIQVYEEFPFKDFEKWFSSFKEDEEFESVFKFDGSSANLILSNGCLISGATRGSKTIGSDITSKVKAIVPNNISSKEVLEIRGEIVMTKNDFEINYSKDYKNPRNLVAGLLGRDDLKGVEHLNFVAFEVRVHKDGEWTLMENSFDFLKENGFKIPTHIKRFKKSEIENIFNFYKSELFLQEFEMDGMVIKTISKETIKDLGETEHHPKWSLAIKFPPTRKSTKILNINWQFGISGRFTPVAELEEIQLSGTSVRNVTLNNYSNVVKNKLGIDSVISVFKSGEIIPKVDEVFETSENFNIPSNCPHCKTELQIDENKTHLFCPNQNCEGLTPLKILSSLRTLGCKSIGESLVERIVSAGFQNLFDILDSSKFNKGNLIISEQFKEGRELEKMLKEIENIKAISCEQALLCLCLPEVGNTMSSKISKFLNGEEVDFSGLTKVVVSSFVEENGEYRKLIESAIEKLKSLNLYKESIKKSINLLKIEMTGSCKEFGFSTKEEFLKELSNFVEVENVSLKEASILVTDDLSSTSSKMKDALKKGKEILTYEEILNRYK